MKNWLLFGIIIFLVGLALTGWQTANSLSQEVAVRDATINNLMVSLRRAENKPPEIIEKQVMVPLTLPDDIDLEQLRLKAKMGEWNHQYYIKNWDLQNNYTGDIRFNQEWAEFYQQIQAILLEIKEKQ